MEAKASSDWQTAVQAAISRARRIAVCGIGNDLRGDDGAGTLCLQKLRAGRKKTAAGGGKTVSFIDGGETPENQTGRIREFRPDLVILIDAARGGGQGGKIHIVNPERIVDDEISTHRLSLGLLVRYIRESIGSAVLFLGIEPESTESAGGVSERVEAAVSKLSEFLLKVL